MLLGVNIDHIATLRNARGTVYPSPVEAALIAETSGADYITMHLREDRRHIKDHDVFAVKENIKTRLNLEMALTDEMLENAIRVKPDDVCIVPEKREEITTEGGLDIIKYYDQINYFVSVLYEEGIRVSLFIDPDIEQIKAASSLNVPVIELHTGTYANANFDNARKELRKIEDAAYFASDLGILVNAGHGLNIHNVAPIAKIIPIGELNIGHSIISQAVFIGLNHAVKEMKELMHKARTTV
ncbi:MAG: pyridoxine 5'-phosphate synthase [Neisseriaceae bacterium]|nr:MAG: pyridoxine 5'-phosphate synthase [Neisseriaceae bacterium]